MRRLLALIGVCGAVLLSPPASAGGWGHGPSFSQGGKIIGQAAKDFHNGVSSIQMGGGPSSGSSAHGAGMREGEDTGGDVSRALAAPVIPAINPRPSGPVIESAQRPVVFGTPDAPPPCDLACQVNGATDNPASDLPHPSESKSAERPPSAQTTTMPVR
jgi:hypothetical protein